MATTALTFLERSKREARHCNSERRRPQNRQGNGQAANVELILPAYKSTQFQMGTAVMSRRGDDPGEGSFLFNILGRRTVSEKSETQSEAKQPKSAAPPKRSTGKSILALAVFALGLNATAAVYTRSPSDFALPDVSRLAELLPHQRASGPLMASASGSLVAKTSLSDPVLAALMDVQSAQQKHAVALLDNGSSLQQNTALLLQDATSLAVLRQSITDEHADVKKISAQIEDEHVDVKKMSAQISTLIAKVDSLQNALAPETTSSIPAGRARNRLSGVLRKKTARQPKPVGPVSVGGAPLTTAPAQGWVQSPEG